MKQLCIPLFRKNKTKPNQSRSSFIIKQRQHHHHEQLERLALAYPCILWRFVSSPITGEGEKHQIPRNMCILVHGRVVSPLNYWNVMGELNLLIWALIQLNVNKLIKMPYKYKWKMDQLKKVANSPKHSYLFTAVHSGKMSVWSLQ